MKADNLSFLEFIGPGKRTFCIPVYQRNYDWKRMQCITLFKDIETIAVDKVGSQIDVLPTIYNLFGVEYDSRLIIGKDILSTEPGLAIFGNSSWVSDKGTYFASSNEFVARDGSEVDSDYIRYMNNVVNNKIVMSKYIMTYDYYRKVMGG